MPQGNTMRKLIHAIRYHIKPFIGTCILMAAALLWLWAIYMIAQDSGGAGIFGG